jgi:chemotaxis protein CheD
VQPLRDDLQPAVGTFIGTGQLAVQRAPGVFTTVVGSCVSVCLWSTQLRLGGMNHYLVPRVLNGQPVSAKAGEPAIAMLLEEVARAGASTPGLVAKIFGGAASGASSWNVGAENVLVAWEALASARVRVGAAVVGGNRGRHLSFDVATGIVRVRYLPEMKAP